MQSPDPYYCAVLEGSFRFADRQSGERILHAGDFLLIPGARDFTMSSTQPSRPEDLVTEPVIAPDGEFLLGRTPAPTDMRCLVGYCEFHSEDAALLSSLLPRVVVVRGEARLAMLMQLLDDETKTQKPARDVILAHLLEVLLIEALRSTADPEGTPGLVRGLADERLAAVIRRMHAQPARAWTAADMARQAALSRSGFYNRFRNAVGMAPMEYLLSWRMALAKDLLRKQEASIAEIAKQVGYQSASAFSVAFIRTVGLPPGRYASQSRAPQPPAGDRLTSTIA